MNRAIKSINQRHFLMGVIPVIAWRGRLELVHKRLSGLDWALRKAGCAIRPGRIFLTNRKLSASATTPSQYCRLKVLIILKSMPMYGHIFLHAINDSYLLALVSASRNVLTPINLSLLQHRPLHPRQVLD
jgi:hypothetical protein